MIGGDRAVGGRPHSAGASSLSWRCSSCAQRPSCAHGWGVGVGLKRCELGSKLDVEVRQQALDTAQVGIGADALIKCERARQRRCDQLRLFQCGAQQGDHRAIRDGGAVVGAGLNGRRVRCSMMGWRHGCHGTSRFPVPTHSNSFACALRRKSAPPPCVARAATRLCHNEERRSALEAVWWRTTTTSTTTT
jgi:hypothetical protein